MSSSPPTKHGELGVAADDDGYSSDTTITQHLLEKESKETMPGTGDIESQQTPPRKDTTSGSHAAEYSVPAKTKYLYLGLYFGLNLSLTLFNKAVLGKASFKNVHDGRIALLMLTIPYKFAFPWLLTTIHTSTAALGCSILLWRGHFQLTTLTTRENMILLAFSFLYTINIAISNVSLYVIAIPHPPSCKAN